MTRHAKAERPENHETERGAWNHDEFLAVISHEIRNTSQIILSWAELLCRRAPTDETMLQGLEVIRHNGRLQTYLLNQLLALSRKQSADLWLDASRVALVPIIEDAIRTMAPQAMEKAIQLSAKIEAPVSTVFGDPVQLEGIFTNLLSNAIKFTPHGGRIEVRLRSSPAGAEISVTDSGQGISPEFLPHVFERFQQERRTQTRCEGIGLGLAITRYLVERHGGTIKALSHGAGQGATFQVCLPFAPEMVARASPSESHAVSVSSHMSD